VLGVLVVSLAPASEALAQGYIAERPNILAQGSTRLHIRPTRSEDKAEVCIILPPLKRYLDMKTDQLTTV
jgi:hypothetical protein